MKNRARMIKYQFALDPIDGREGDVREIALKPDRYFKPTMIGGSADSAKMTLCGLVVDGIDWVPSPFREKGLPPLLGVGVFKVEAGGGKPGEPIVVRLRFAEDGRWIGGVIGWAPEDDA